ncbi:hypothetical protein [Roseiflexus sp.]|uniref:hypothetical protein n=1 Tax=Roseiflexus sp. TaxID=2562120 RepID=UPI00398AEE5E
MQRVTRNFMIPLLAIPRQWRLWRPSLRLTKRALLLASIFLALLIWQIGAPPVAILIGGGAALTSVAGIWWRWATRQSPPRRPTLFVIRYRQQQAMRLLRSVEDDLSRNIVMVDTLVQALERVYRAADADHDGRDGEAVVEGTVHNRECGGSS